VGDVSEARVAGSGPAIERRIIARAPEKDPKSLCVVAREKHSLNKMESPTVASARGLRPKEASAKLRTGSALFIKIGAAQKPARLLDASSARSFSAASPGKTCTMPRASVQLKIKRRGALSRLSRTTVD